MNLINNITDYPLQTITFVLDDGTNFNLTLYFNAGSQGWFIRNLTYNSFVLNNVRISNNPNILYQWQNIVPQFGLACFPSLIGGREPMFQEDFASGACSLYVLSASEVLAYSEFIRSGAFPT